MKGLVPVIRRVGVEEDVKPTIFFYQGTMSGAYHEWAVKDNMMNVTHRKRTVTKYKKETGS